MIWGMNLMTARLASDRAAAPSLRWLPPALAGLAGCLFLAVASSPPGNYQQVPFLNLPFDSGGGGTANLADWLYLVAPAVAALAGLCLLRWWPYLLAAAALLAGPDVLAEWGLAVGYPWNILPLSTAGYALAIVALLACAQGLARIAAAWAAALTALALGSRVAGSAMMSGLSWNPALRTPAAWHTALLAVGLAALAPATWRYRRGDPAAAGPAGQQPGRRARLVLIGTLAAAVAIPLQFLTTQHLADVLGVAWSALYRNGVQGPVIAVVTVLAMTLLAALAGLWPLAGVMTAAVAQMAMTVPVIFALTALAGDDPLRWLGALAGAALGATVAGSRWRIPLAAALTVLAAITLAVAYNATSGDPQKLAEQHIVIPSMLVLLVCAAAGGAVTGASAPVLAARGALPAVLGPLGATLVIGGMHTVAVTNRSSSGLPTEAAPLTTAAILFLVAGVAIGGLAFAQLLATRSAERKQAEQIRREAAAAERDRLGRSIHDGVLQVLALVQRQGSELGTEGRELAALAGEQEVALRGLLASEASTGGGGAEDLRAPLQALAAPAVEVATPAQAVRLPSGITAEVVAAVQAALDNVRKHAGPAAQAWILLEDEQDGVRVSVRDDGSGFPPERVAQAAEAGRLGIAQSMRGRIADCGGTTSIDSRPGEGTEVEFWIPRPGRTRR